jgi:hypothetical protein
MDGMRAGAQDHLAVNQFAQERVGAAHIVRVAGVMVAA